MYICIVKNSEKNYVPFKNDLPIQKVRFNSLLNVEIL